MKINILANNLNTTDQKIYDYIRILRMPSSNGKRINLDSEQVTKITQFHHAKKTCFSLYQIAKESSYSYTWIHKLAYGLNAEPKVFGEYVHLYTQEQKDMILEMLNPDKKAKDLDDAKRFETVESAQGLMETATVLSTFGESIPNAMALTRKVKSEDLKAYRLENNKRKTFYLAEEIEEAIEAGIFEKRKAGPKFKAKSIAKKEEAKKFDLKTKGMIRVNDAAEVLSISRQAVHDLIKKKVLVPDFITTKNVNYFNAAKLETFKTIHYN